MIREKIHNISGSVKMAFFASILGMLSSHDIPQKESSTIKEVRKCILENNDIYREDVFAIDSNQSILYTPEILQHSSLPEVQFWQHILDLSEENRVINNATTRKIYDTIAHTTWDSMSAEQKESYREGMRVKNNISKDDEIYCTQGKCSYYNFDHSAIKIDKALDIFQKNNTDGFYAQTILLIESPSSNHTTSFQGARGAFQLMPDVAKKYGLTVNEHYDERTSLERSAYGASRFIQEVCIPDMQNTMEQYTQAQFLQTELWFRLLVLHAYHAGTTNVQAALAEVYKNNPEIFQSPDMRIIQSLWHTQARSFGNASQNYSQVALAATLKFYKQHIDFEENKEIVPLSQN